MKYMTFNSSCSYAGLANMLAFYGIDTTDREIALEMGLPYLLAHEDGAYLAGPSLQNARWFDLYLNPRGFSLVETPVEKENVPRFLREQSCAMLGLILENTGKHAVIFTGMDGNCFCFLNNKWEQEPSPDTLRLTEAELLSRLEGTCIVAVLQPIFPRPAPIRERMEASLALWTQYEQALVEVCTQTRPTGELRSLLNPLFRALLLDGITMMELLGNQALHSKLTGLQRNLLTALRSQEPTLCLAEHLSTDDLRAAAEEYRQMIQQQLISEFW